MSARAGIVGKEETRCSSITTDARAKSSRWGVQTTGPPYAPRWSRRKVAETIIRKFGRTGADILVLLRRITSQVADARAAAHAGRPSTGCPPDDPCCRKPQRP